MIELPIGVALLRAAFPDWRITENGEAWFATRRRIESETACSRRSAAIGRRVLTADTPADLAIQLAALEYPLGITTVS